ncbi:MAG: LptF/LptG family permease [Elusimicrobia bacterium]|nr:LptF/LptG family permease [Elusimicrobiota bacterium]
MRARPPWMTPLLARYFLGVFIPVFLLCVGVFTGVLLMNQFLRLFNMALLKGISLFWIAGCFARLLPYFLSLAVPMAFLVAVLLSLGQLCEQGEVTALRASGFSFFDMTWPFLLVACVFSAGLFVANHKTAPEGFHSFRKQYQIAAQQIAKVELQPGSFMRLGRWNLYARRAEPDTGRLGGVYLVRVGQGRRGLRVSARRGLLSVDKGKSLELVLENGSLQLPNAEPEKLTAGRFSRYSLRVPLADKPDAQRPLDIPEINSTGLQARLREPLTTAQHRNEYRVELSVRSAAAFAPLVFFWIGAPLGLRLHKNSRGMGFAASIFILIGFYGLLAVGIGLGRRHDQLAMFAPWLADAAGLALGAVITRRALLK